jgi:uncharacterized lipoprotein NlpE involved in copper resistance
MKKELISLVALFFLLLGCKNDDNQRAIEQEKDIKKKELVFENINKDWNFNVPNLNPQAQVLVNNWTEWRLFKEDINQKPKSSIGAFQQKSKSLSKKVTDLSLAIPPQIATTAVKSRISVLTTQIKMLELYMNLQQIPYEKVKLMVPEINLGIASLNAQFEEIIRKQQIPLEKGESDMIRMLDTARAIPSGRQ